MTIHKNAAELGINKIDDLNVMMEKQALGTTVL